MKNFGGSWNNFVPKRGTAIAKEEKEGKRVEKG